MAAEPITSQTGLNGLSLDTRRGPAQQRPPAGFQGAGIETLRTEFVQRSIGLKGYGMELTPVAPGQVLRKTQAH